MTKEELEKVRFRMVSHLSLEGQHQSCYITDDCKPLLSMCSVTGYRNGLPYGKTKRYYQFNGKEYKSTDALLKAISEYEIANNTKVYKIIKMP